MQNRENIYKSANDQFENYNLTAIYELHPNLAKRFEDLRFIINAALNSLDAGRKVASDLSLLFVDLRDLLAKISSEKGLKISRICLRKTS